MNQRIKASWIAALRSGAYQQTQHKLRTSDGYCCLGVLCALYVQEQKIPWGDLMVPEDEVLPSQVAKWAEVPNENPLVNGIQLAIYNDGSGVRELRPHSFAEIADLIEQHL